MPRGPEPSWEDGIRSLRREEFEGLRDLVGTVFRPSLVEEYPYFYTPEHAGEMRVAVVDGKVVSHMGALRRYASIFGCTVRTASLGGVATHPDYRGKGYATAILEDTIRVCRGDGVDFMLVSGYRKMYHRHGCRYVGRDWNYTVTAEQAGAFSDAKVEIAEAGPEDAAAMAAIYRREPVRWLRPLSDYTDSMRGFVMNRPARFLTVRERGVLRGYLVVQQARERDEGRVQVVEFSGDRRCVAGALGKVIETYGLKALGLHVAGWDAPMQDVLREGGLSGAPANASGTVTMIHFVQFMERMRPYFAEVVGEAAAQGLVFREEGDEMAFYYGGGRVVAQCPGAAVQLIFGTLDGAEEGMLKAGGRAGEVLREVLPIPALWYGINYL